MRPLLYLPYRWLRRHLPPALTYRLASRDTTPAESLCEDAWLFFRLLTSHGIDCRGKRIAEIGPGTLNPFSVLLLKHEAAGIDLIEPYPRALNYDHLQQRLKLWWQYQPGGLPWPENLVGANGFDARKVVRYQGLAESLPLPDHSVDMVLSTMAMQFVAEPKKALREMHRVLKPQGRILHVIDFRDHFFKYPLEMLTFSEPEWRRLSPLKEGRGWHNRLRASHWIAHAKAAGFAELQSGPLEERPDAAQDIRPRLHPDFAALAQSDLATTVAWVLGVKP
jgi:SAM-dependent methyltransferase